jgi:hypothetical protein
MIADTIALAIGSFADSKRAQQAVEDLYRAGFREENCIDLGAARLERRLRPDLSLSFGGRFLGGSRFG